MVGTGYREGKSTWEEGLFQSLYRMIQTVRIHQDNNHLVKLCLSQFKETVSAPNSQEDVTVQISDARFYVGHEKVQYGKKLTRIIETMLDFFKRRDLTGLRIHPSVKEVDLDDLLGFVRLLIYSAEKDDPAAWLLHKTGETKYSWVTIFRGNGLKPTRVGDLREKAKSTYFSALNSIKDVAQKISLQGNAGVRRAKRMVQNMLDCLVEDESLFLCLSTIRDYDDYTYTHSVNVAVLSLCLGNRIGLSRVSLAHLGICGLFHDLGKVEVPHEILAKAGQLTELEWTEMRRHPMTSVEQILKLRVSHDVKSKILIAPFEHHIKFDLSGYPRVHRKKVVSLFGRILQITDVYDAITSPRAYRPFALSPDQAISHMMEGAGAEYDPILLKVFAMMMGTYPVGSLLQLNTGELGLVAQYPLQTGSKSPRIVLLRKDENGNLLRGDTISLSEPDTETGACRRTIVKSLNPALYGIQPASFLL
jgi:HD-GYP domain-containing protein (c-di-GMP phosphodiesterase class II)